MLRCAHAATSVDVRAGCGRSLTSRYRPSATMAGRPIVRRAPRLGRFQDFRTFGLLDRSRTIQKSKTLFAECSPKRRSARQKPSQRRAASRASARLLDRFSGPPRVATQSKTPSPAGYPRMENGRSARASLTVCLPYVATLTPPPSQRTPQPTSAQRLPICVAKNRFRDKSRASDPSPQESIATPIPVVATNDAPTRAPEKTYELIVSPVSRKRQIARPSSQGNL